MLTLSQSPGNVTGHGRDPGSDEHTEKVLSHAARVGGRVFDADEVDLSAACRVGRLDAHLRSGASGGEYRSRSVQCRDPCGDAGAVRELEHPESYIIGVVVVRAINRRAERDRRAGACTVSPVSTWVQVSFGT